MSKQASQTSQTKTLTVTETVVYEFEVPASMPENDEALRRFFAGKADPWAEADFAAVAERDFEVGIPRAEDGRFTESETARPLAAW